MNGDYLTEEITQSADIIEAINQLTETVTSQASANFSEVMIAILTAIYVGATILIWRSNKKSANAATKQVEEMKNIQQQNVNIQLFEKRHDVYSTLNIWHQITKLALSKTILNPSTGDSLAPKRAFTKILYQNTELIFFGRHYENVEEYISSLNYALQKATNNLETADSEEKKKELENIRNGYSHMVYTVSEVVNRTKNERIKIEYAKHIYSSINFSIIISFTDAFLAAVCVVSDYNMNELEKAYKSFDEANILAEMEKMLKL